MKPRRILFIAPTRIGDAVLASSILRHLLTTEPDARVTIVTSPLAADLFEGFPQLERIIRITKRSYNRHWMRVWREVIGTKWDAVWDMRGSIVTFLIRAGSRKSYSPQGIAPKVKQYEHAFGVTDLPYPILWPHDEDTTRAEQLLPAGTHYLILAPIANWEPKEWPMAHFITLAQDLLNGICQNYRPVIICAGHEHEEALPLLEALKPYHPIDLTTGDAPLLTIYASMQRAQGFIGNDSGLMHMAAASAIPTLGLFGPTDSTVYQPWGEHATFVTAPEGDLAQLMPSQVENAFTLLIEKS